MSQHGVVHFEITGPDPKALQDFYGKLFGWTIDADNPMNYALVARMEGGIGGGISSPPDGTSYVTFYVGCEGKDDLRSTLVKAESMGATKVIDVMDAGEGAPTIAMFTDPDGNLIGLVAIEPGDAPVVNGGGAPVVHFEIAGADAGKTQGFYRDLLGWDIKADNPMQYGETPAIGGGIGGGIFGGMGNTGTTIYAQVPSLEDALAKAGELGGKTLMEPADVPGGPRIAQLADPAGNGVGLIQAGTGRG